MAELCLAKETVWYDQNRYEQAEARYQEIVASRHAGLKVEGKAVAPCGSGVSSKLQEAREMIAQSLKSAGEGSGMEARVTQLERENRELKSTLQSVCARLSALEGQVKKGGPMAAAQPSQQQKTEKEDKEEEDDDDFELFGSDDEQDAEAERVKEERLAAYAEKKKNKKTVVAKSSIVLEVKPWDDETDMKEVEKHVRTVATDGLLWGASKLVPVGYGIMKLQISCVVEDDKVGTDFLEESITAFEDLVQSVDIVAFNKI